LSATSRALLRRLAERNGGVRHSFTRTTQAEPRATTTSPRPFQFSQLWHPRNDRDPPHRWLRGIVTRAARGTRRRT